MRDGIVVVCVDREGKIDSVTVPRRRRCLIGWEWMLRGGIMKVARIDECGTVDGKK